MLNSLAIALLCDSRTVDGAGLAITKDYSRHGLHAQLGDGATAATIPTLDALNGRMVFSGTSYMVLRQADDVDDVLADMGSIQDETYIFYLDHITAVDPTIQHVLSTDDGANPRFYFRLDGRAANRTFEVTITDSIGGTENHRLVGSLDNYQGRGVVWAVTREPSLATDRSKMYLNAARVSTDNDVSVDGSSVKNKRLGMDLQAFYPLVVGTGLRFFGYARGTAWTQTQLSALQRFLRGNL